MSTSDQQGGQLTRKQLREIRLTGSTPVISAEDAEAAAEARAAVAAAPLPRAAEPVVVPPAPSTDIPAEGAPLTRRQVREQERTRTGSVSVVDDADAAGEAPVAEDEPLVEEEPVVEEAPVGEESSPAEPELVSGLPVFAAAAPAPVFPPVVEDDLDDEDLDEEIAVVPVSAAAAVDASGEVPLAGASADSDEPEDTPEDAFQAAEALGFDVDADDGDDVDAVDPDDVLSDVGASEDVLTTGERPTVNPAFGEAVIGEAVPARSTLPPSFDELLTVGDSAGSHIASSALIYTQSPGEGSLSGPVAATGEVLVTGSYELPKGIGSQGHAEGVADGKDVDAVLIDGELPPASSPTPIAASSAVSTIKPAGEVIRPPAPEKGNKLMLTLAIVAGGLALALGVVLIVAFTTNVF